MPELYTLKKYAEAFDNKVTVAGSFALWAYKTLIMLRSPKWKPNDIDIFHLERDADMSKIEGVFPSSTVTLARDCVHDVTIPDLGMPLQVISPRAQFTEPLAVTKGFDIDVCRVAMVFEPKTMFVSFYTPLGVKEAIRDLTATFRFAISEKNQPFAERRVLRYMGRGFTLRMADEPADDCYTSHYYGEE